jgi:hypothetical protein
MYFPSSLFFVFALFCFLNGTLYLENWNIVFVIVLEKYKKKVCFSQFLSFVFEICK